MIMSLCFSVRANLGDLALELKIATWAMKCSPQTQSTSTKHKRKPSCGPISAVDGSTGSTSSVRILKVDNCSTGKRCDGTCTDERYEETSM